jgi:hypothetical protein
MNASAMAGLVLMIVTETATLAGIEPFASWNTPIAWTGFIVFADGVVWRVRGQSWIRSAPREFALLAIVSIPLWLVFEGYNLFINNWYYTGLPENAFLRQFGYAWSFATIWPAIFEGADLIAACRSNSRCSTKTAPAREFREHVVAREHTTRVVAPEVSRAHLASMAIGAAMLAWPLVRPSPYLAAPVWLGFIFLLEPINVRLGGESLWSDFQLGEFSRVKNLMLSGFLCGMLWEFWNYWSRAKWHYTVPIMETVKIFEMPLPGYLGFPAFALECFAMYVFVRAVAVRLVGVQLKRDGIPDLAGAGARRTSGSHGRRIAL